MEREPTKADGAATAERQAQEVIEQSHDKLRRLAASTTMVLENERLAISRRIHDDLGQYLTALRLDAAFILKRLPTEDDATRQRATEMIQTIDETISSVQAIAGELRPGALDRLGLPAAIEDQGRRFGKRTGIECVLEIDPSARPVDDLLSVAVYRIAQELLTNVARHAEATSVRLGLSRGNQALRLRVQDDGTGITEAQMLSPTALGITGIRERVLSHGGCVTFVGSPGRGTDVVVELPVATWFSAEPAGGAG
jgi:signal transduction histidine kinase